MDVSIIKSFWADPEHGIDYLRANDGKHGTVFMYHHKIKNIFINLKLF